MHTSQDLREQGYDAADFCSTKQAATLLGVSHRTVQLWVESGVLQAWKTAGGHRRIMLASVKRLVDQRSQAIQRPLAHAQTPAQRKVLLVDDDPTSLRLYEFEVKSWGLPLQVLKASNGLEALIKIGESRPDLLITDLSMPGVDGFRMIRTLRADPIYGRMAIIVISGLDRTTIKSMGLPEDIPVFIKPVRLADLQEAVELALGQPA
ncbi:MAG TPA: response regulator [Telluria sp.]